MKRTRGIATSLALALALSACGSSHTTFNVSRSDLEKQAADQLSKTSKAGVVPTITCPGDLQAKVGNHITCALTEPNNVHSYAAVITLSSVDNTKQTANFKVDVAASPNP